MSTQEQRGGSFLKHNPQTYLPVPTLNNIFRYKDGYMSYNGTMNYYYQINDKKYKRGPKIYAPNTNINYAYEYYNEVLLSDKIKIYSWVPGYTYLDNSDSPIYKFINYGDPEIYQYILKTEINSDVPTFIRIINAYYYLKNYFNNNNIVNIVDKNNYIKEFLNSKTIFLQAKQNVYQCKKENWANEYNFEMKDKMKGIFSWITKPGFFIKDQNNKLLHNGIISIYIEDPTTTQPTQPSQGGAKKTPSPKATPRRVMVDGKAHVVYEGPRGGEYVKRNHSFVRISKTQVPPKKK